MGGGTGRLVDRVVDREAAGGDIPGEGEDARLAPFRGVLGRSQVDRGPHVVVRNQHGRAARTADRVGPAGPGTRLNPHHDRLAGFHQAVVDGDHAEVHRGGAGGKRHAPTGGRRAVIRPVNGRARRLVDRVIHHQAADGRVPREGHIARLAPFRGVLAQGHSHGRKQLPGFQRFQRQPPRPAIGGSLRIPPGSETQFRQRLPPETDGKMHWATPR